MFDLTILSIFRESEQYLPRYFSQIEKAFTMNGGKCHAIWLEGDSKDRSYALLQNEKAKLEKLGHQVTLVKFEIGGIYWPQDNIPDRWKQIATCWNKCLDHLQPSKITICVESDLIWQPEIVSSLAAKLDVEHHVILPMLMIESSMEIFGEDWFYDIWAFSRGGRKFRSVKPYWSKDKRLKEEPELLEICSGAGMIVTTYDVQKSARWNLRNCIMDFPESTRIFMDKTLKIYHPSPHYWKNYNKIGIILRKIRRRFDIRKKVPI